MNVTSIVWKLAPRRLSLATDEVHAWRIDLEQPSARVRSLRDLLSDDEREKSESFHFARDCGRYIVSRGALRFDPLPIPRTFSRVVAVRLRAVRETVSERRDR